MKVQESFNDYQFKVKCNDQPEILVNVVAETEDKAQKYAKDMYAKQHTTYADDRENKWSISRTNNPAEGNTIYEDGNVAKYIQDKINSAVDASTIIPDEVKSELKSIIISKSGKTRSGNRWYGQKLPAAVLKKYYPHYDYVSYNDAFRNDQFNGEGGSTFTDLVDAIYDAMKDKWNLTNKNESYDDNESGALDYIADAKDYINAGNIPPAIDSLNSAIKILNRLNVNINESEDGSYGVHHFTSGSILFKGTSEECGKYINDHKLEDEAEIYDLSSLKVNESSDAITSESVYAYFFPGVGKKVMKKSQAINEARKKLDIMENSNGAGEVGQGFAIYCTNSFEEGDGEEWIARNTAEEFIRSLNESFDADRVQKRIASVDEFNNGNVINNDYFNASSSEAEEIARQASLKDPSKIFYVKYDDVMNPSSDIKWKNGEKVDHLGKKLTNESIIRYPNGMEVTDVDLDRALDYQYGTDRDMDNSKYTDDEKQRAVTYWIKKTDPSPYDEAKVPNDKGELTALKTKLVEVGTKLRTKNGHLIIIENISASFDLDGKGKPFFDYSFEKADGTTGKSHCDDYSLNRMFYGLDEQLTEASDKLTSAELFDKLKSKLDEFCKDKGWDESTDMVDIELESFEGTEIIRGKEEVVKGYKYTVRGELTYDTLDQLADELDKVFKDSGIDAYFEGEVPGRWVAVVWDGDVTESVKLMNSVDRMIENINSVVGNEKCKNESWRSKK